MLIMRPLAWERGACFALLIALTGSPPFPCRQLTAQGKGRPDGPGSPASWQALAQTGGYRQAADGLKARLALPDLGNQEKAGLFHALGHLLLYAGRAGEAAQSLRQAIEWARTRGLSREAASFEAEMAIQTALAKAIELRNAGDIAGSNVRFEEAERLALASGSRAYELKIVSTWGLNFLMAKDGRPRAAALSQRALALADSLGYRHEAALSAERLGVSCALNNEYSRALGYFLAALEGTAGTGADADRVARLNNIAVIYGALGDYIKAGDYLMEAVGGVPKDPLGEFESSLLINFGNLFAGLGQRLSSDVYRQRALVFFEACLGPDGAAGVGRLRPQALTGMGRVFVDQGRLLEGRAILAPALEAARRAAGAGPTVGTILCLLGEIALRTGAVPEADRYFKEAWALVEQAGSLSLASSAAYGLGRAAEMRQEIDQAAAWYELALRVAGDGFSGIASDIQRAELLGRNREPFQALVGLYLRLSKSRDKRFYEREAFRLVEYFRGRSFLEFKARLARGSAKEAPPSPEEAKLAGERLEILKSLSQGEPDAGGRDRLEDRIVRIDDLLDAALFERRPDPDPTLRSPKPVPLGAIQGLIPDERTAVLEFLLGETSSVLFCIRRDTLDLVDLPSGPAIDDAVAGFLSFLEDPSLAPDKGLPAARRLYRLLLAPAERCLGGPVDRLVIVPDGVLFRLPFEALALPDAGEKPAYLAERFVVSYAPSASSLAASAAMPNASYPKDALAFGISRYPRLAPGRSGSRPRTPGAVLDDVYKRRGFEAGSLPRVHDEIEDLRKRVPPGRGDFFEDEAATERVLKSLDLRRYRLIHLACHAFSDETYPLRSALRLASGEGEDEDGYLQVSEMYDLRTSADLVVLSSCQTGRGTIVTNEGNLGLPRVLFYTGARSVLSSLWPVDDRASALFMKLFYDSYFGGLGKADALQSAKRSMLRTRFAHPFYWGSFVLTGGF